jgi:YfiH family protein
MSTPVLYEKTFARGVFRVYDGAPDDQPLVMVKQVHGTRVLDVDAPDLAQQEADGLWASWRAHRHPAIKTADCLPVLVMGEGGYAILHAGWRGLAADILAHPAVAALRPTEAFIGPCIHACCFEVTPEFQQHFPDRRLLARGGSLAFDLVAEALERLRRLYPGIRAQDSGECTCCVTKYSSFRRDKTTRRIWNCFLPLAQ